MTSFDAPPPAYFADPPPPPPPAHRSRFGWVVAAVVLAGAGIGGYAIAEAVSATTAASSVINTSAGGANASVQAATNPQAATPSPTMHCPNMGGSSGSSTSTSGYFPG